MGTAHKTPTDRPTAICPHCRRRRVIMYSGLFEIHFVKGQWKEWLCRGSGEPARPKK